MVDTETDRARRILTSNKRWRVLFALLAVVATPAFAWQVHRHHAELAGLADHGRAGTAVVTSIARTDTGEYTHYRYEVDGQTFTWSVSRKDGPFAANERFPITYLPEKPSVSRPGTYSAARLEAESDTGLVRGMIVGLFLFFATFAVVCHRAVVRAESGAPPRTKPLLTPVAAGRLMGLLMMGAPVYAGLTPEAAAVQTKLFGPTAFGLPIAVVVTVVQVALFAPLLWVMPHLMIIVMDAVAKGGASNRLGIVMAVVNAGPEHRRSRAIVIAGLVYLVAIMAAWIAFTDARGV